MAAHGCYAAGITPPGIARVLDLGEFAALTDPEWSVGNLHRAPAEIDCLAPGAPIDAPAALADMVEFKGVSRSAASPHRLRCRCSWLERQPEGTDE